MLLQRQADGRGATSATAVASIVAKSAA